MKQSKEEIKTKRAIGRMLSRYLKRKNEMSEVALQILCRAIINAESKVSR